MHFPILPKPIVDSIQKIWNWLKNRIFIFQKVEDLEKEIKRLQSEVIPKDHWDEQQKKLHKISPNFYKESDSDIFYCIPCSNTKRKLIGAYNNDRDWTCSECHNYDWKPGRKPQNVIDEDFGDGIVNY